MQRIVRLSFVVALIFIARLLAQAAIAAEARLFDLRAVVQTPTQTSELYTLPQRNGKPEQILVEPEVLLDESTLRHASVEDDDDGSPQIALRFSNAGAKRFAELTEEFTSRRLGIFLDGQLRSAPVIRERLDGGVAIVSGTLNKQDAEQLVAKLNTAASAGPLPDEFKPITNFSACKTDEDLWQLLEAQQDFERQFRPGEVWTTGENKAARQRQYAIATELLRRFPNSSHRWEAKKIRSDTRDTDERYKEGKDLIQELATALNVPSEIRKWARHEFIDHFVVGKGQSGEPEIENYCREYPEEVDRWALLRLDAADWYFYSGEAANREKGELLLQNLIANGPDWIVGRAEKLLADKEKIQAANEERRKRSGIR